jgi:protein gp37
MTHDELQKVRNALAVATTHFARDRNVVLDAIVILNNALAEPSQRTWQGLTQSDFNEIYDLFANKVSSDFIFEKMYSTIEAKLKERNI